MRAPRASILILHAGPPTSVTNATLAGLLESLRHECAVGDVYGARMGWEGAFEDDWLDLRMQPALLTQELACTPGSALGCSHTPLAEVQAPLLAEALVQRGIDAVVVSGGVQAMAGASMLHRAARQSGLPLHVIGIPEDSTNRVLGGDHALGYDSAASYCLRAVLDLGEANASQPAPIVLVEVPGSGCGWLAAATVLARSHADDPPHALLMPEAAASANTLKPVIEVLLERLGHALAVVPEGQGAVLAGRLEQIFKAGVKVERLGDLALCSSMLVSETDRREAYRSGQAALLAVVNGLTGIALTPGRRLAPDAPAAIVQAGLASVASGSRFVPAGWIPYVNGPLSASFRQWLTGLLIPPPGYPRLHSWAAIARAVSA